MLARERLGLRSWAEWYALSDYDRQTWLAHVTNDLTGAYLPPKARRRPPKKR
jgi:hypothetical protein